MTRTGPKVLMVTDAKTPSYKGKMPTLPRMGWMCFGVSRKFRSRRTQSMILPLCNKKIALKGERIPTK
jgi:hypothetical protein